MSVYFIRSDDLIKIGFSGDVRTRVSNVIKGLRNGGQYLGYMAGDRSVERHLHDRFAADREFGEWFRVTPALVEMVGTLAAADYPDDEKMNPRDRLRQQDERYADECALFIHDYCSGLLDTKSAIAGLADVVGMSNLRLLAIHSGEVQSVTLGEYTVLQQASQVGQSVAA